MLTKYVFIAALKHYTSKLTTYDDLDNVETFGFRGEALSSLCALSNLQILTATKEDAPKGSRLDFETSGKLKSVSVVAAQKGTTVIAEDLFRPLPVRRKELERNIKREYTKVLGLLQAYASISTNVKFSVFNQPAKGFVHCSCFCFLSKYTTNCGRKKENTSICYQSQSDYKREYLERVWSKDLDSAGTARPRV